VERVEQVKEVESRSELNPLNLLPFLHLSNQFVENALATSKIIYNSTENPATCGLFLAAKNKNNDRQN
jgi:hypothetical protein